MLKSIDPTKNIISVSIYQRIDNELSLVNSWWTDKPYWNYWLRVITEFYQGDEFKLIIKFIPDASNIMKAAGRIQ